MVRHFTRIERFLTKIHILTWFPGNLSPRMELYDLHWFTPSLRSRLKVNSRSQVGFWTEESTKFSASLHQMKNRSTTLKSLTVLKLMNLALTPCGRRIVGIPSNRFNSAIPVKSPGPLC